MNQEKKYRHSHMDVHIIHGDAPQSSSETQHKLEDSITVDKSMAKVKRILPSNPSG